MRLKIHVIAGYVTLFWFAPVYADPPKPEKGTVSGRVVTLEGKPIAEAHIGLRKNGELVCAEARSDAGGHFRLGPCPAMGGFREEGIELLVEANGLARNYRTGVTVFAGADHDLGEIVLTPGPRVSGQVLDVDGKPRANAVVQVEACRFLLGHTIGWIGPQWELRTDAKGQFRTAPLPVSTTSFVVRVPERRSAFAKRVIVPGEGEIMLEPFHLEPDEPIHVRLQDEQGRPIAGAMGVWNGGEKATSDKEGQFAIRGFGGTKFYVQLNVAAPDYVMETRIIKEARDLTVRLKSRRQITGKAIDADTGQPVRLAGATLCNYQKRADGTITFLG